MPSFRRPSEVWVDLAVFTLSDPQDSLNLISFISRERIDVLCYSFLDRDITREILRFRGLLHHLDDVVYSPSEFPDSVLLIPEPLDWKVLPWFLGPPRDRRSFLTWRLV